MCFRSVGFEFLQGALALFILFIGPFAEFAQKLYIFHFLGFGLDACTFKVIPTRASALSFVAALNPIALLNYFAADAFLLLLVLAISSFGVFLKSFTLWIALGWLFQGTLVISFDFLSLINILLFEIVEDYSLKVKGVEKSAFSQGLYMIRVDGSDLEGMLSQLNDSTVFWHF